MNIPRFWIKGPESPLVKARSPMTGEESGGFSCWGWSDLSMEDAEERARLRTEKVAKIICAEERPDAYLYGDVPMREEILDELKRDDSSVYAAVTRNAYGCEVLNTSNIMFIDIDLPEVKGWQSIKHGFSKLFGKSSPSPREEQESHVLAKVKDLVKTDRMCGIRIYRTRAGFRYLITHQHADPTSEETMQFMEALGVDPLYLHLCKIQECFRARLTPKPWRCGSYPLPKTCRYPWSHGEMERQARMWVESYSTSAKSYATCELIDHLGTKNMDHEISRVVEYHDEMTKAESGLALA